MIKGAIDIKSNDNDDAKVGYWCSADTPGFMSNVLIKLCQPAKKSRYTQLFALTDTYNFKSQVVLKRAGFQLINQADPGKFIFRILL